MEAMDKEDAEVIKSWITRSEADIAAGRVLTLEESDARLREYTIEELKARIDQAEAEDPEGMDWEDFAKELKREFPWLHDE